MRFSLHSVVLIGIDFLRWSVIVLALNDFAILSQGIGNCCESYDPPT